MCDTFLCACVCVRAWVVCVHATNMHSGCVWNLYVNMQNQNCKTIWHFALPCHLSCATCVSTLSSLTLTSTHTHTLPYPNSHLPPPSSVCSSGRCVWRWCSVQRVRGICEWGLLYPSLVPCPAWEPWWQRRATSPRIRYTDRHTQCDTLVLLCDKLQWSLKPVNQHLNSLKLKWSTGTHTL